MCRTRCTAHVALRGLHCAFIIVGGTSSLRAHGPEGGRTPPQIKKHAVRVFPIPHQIDKL